MNKILFLLSFIFFSFSSIGLSSENKTSKKVFLSSIDFSKEFQESKRINLIKILDSKLENKYHVKKLNDLKLNEKYLLKNEIIEIEKKINNKNCKRICKSKIDKVLRILKIDFYLNIILIKKKRL